MFERSAGAPVGAAETPWGQSWADVVSGLRPTADENARLAAIIARVEDALRTATPRPVSVARVVAGGPFGKGTHSRGFPDDAVAPAPSAGLGGRASSHGMKLTNATGTAAGTATAAPGGDNGTPDLSRRSFSLAAAAPSAAPILPIYAVFEDAFDPANYFEEHLKLLFDAISGTNDSPFVNVQDRGLAVHFVSDGIQCMLYAAGVLYGGPKDLLLDTPARHLANGATGGVALDPREVHVETSAALLRIDLIRAQSPLYKDMVRIAKKWRDSCDFLFPGSAPGDYLIELLMLEAFHGAPAAAAPSPDLFTSIFRRFLALVCSESGTGSEVHSSTDMPKSFLCWTTYYSRATVDHCIAKGHLVIDNRDPDAGTLVIVDPAVPFIDVARTVTDWTDLRAMARAGLAHFQSTEMIQVLDGRLKSLSEAVQKTMASLESKVEHLEMVERAPRRWAGSIQFKDTHLNSDAWVLLVEVELRCLLWRVHARRPRGETSGYTQSVDLSLQVVGLVPRQLDVDVNYRGQDSRLKFDDTVDHVLIARRSEVVRNRDYTIQLTVIS